MSINRIALLVLLTFGMFLSGGCASLPGREPVQVIIAGVEPLQGEGLELRMLVKLRVQNPGDLALDYNGVSVQLDVQGKPFATGVSNAVGSIPRFSDAIIDVPVSISIFNIANQAIGAMTREYAGKISYEMTGKLAGPVFGSQHFKSNGELTLPAEILKVNK